MLEVNNVGFHYGGGPWVLKDVSLKVADGERIAILGPSGYGKSTLAKLMAGYERPAEGMVLWNGAPLRSCLCGLFEVAGLKRPEDMFIHLKVCCPTPERLDRIKFL